MMAADWLDIAADLDHLVDKIRGAADRDSRKRCSQVLHAATKARDIAQGLAPPSDEQAIAERYRVQGEHNLAIHKAGQ